MTTATLDLKEQLSARRKQRTADYRLLVIRAAEGQEIDPDEADVILTAAGIDPEQFGSIPLMQFGAYAAWGMIQHTVEAMGGRIVRDKVSRVDACVDLADVSVAELVAAYRADWIVTRGRSRADYAQSLPLSAYCLGSQPTGFSVGRSPIMVRVYDKLIETANQPEKRSLLVANRWGCPPESATRVEFQLGRERLKRFGVDSVGDWFAKRGAVCDTLVRGWCRVTAGPVDRKHADRVPLHPIWETAAEKFAEWCATPLDVELTPLDRIEIDTSKQMHQVVGMLSSNFARVGKPISDNEHFMREAVFHIREAVGERDMAEVVRRKSLERGIAPMTGRRGKEAA